MYCFCCLIFFFGLLLTTPFLLIPDADLTLAQTSASLTSLMNSLHFFLPLAIVVIIFSLIGYYLWVVRQAKTKKTRVWLALIPIFILGARSIYPIYDNFFATSTDIGYITYEDPYTKQVGFAPETLLETYDKYNMDLNPSGSSIVWFDNSKENLAVGDKVEIITRGATHSQKITGRDILNVLHIEKVKDAN